jgi:hypothetical protein
VVEDNNKEIDMTNVKKSWKTHGKMELQAVVKPNTSHLIFQWSDGGEIPNALSGTYTSLVFMNTDVASYLANTEPKPEVDLLAKAKAKTEKRLAKKKLKEEMNGTESRSSL